MTEYCWGIAKKECVKEGFRSLHIEWHAKHVEHNRTDFRLFGNYQGPGRPKCVPQIIVWTIKDALITELAKRQGVFEIEVVPAISITEIQSSMVYG
ncbi:MAG: hypothetical protein EAX95_03245 [Candidatus Thorarchaeota archaeon]|nr:hypothetical protein [Candidatus Thorarchaeota archaeon]